jgi:PTH1 family peptidyl-tRNA hydrolase
LLAVKYSVHLKKPMFKLFLMGKFIHNQEKIYLVKPLTYMNLSGVIMKDVFKLTKAGIDNLITICDTLDLPPGKCRLKSKGSSAGQKGLQSIIHAVQTDVFLRLFIGIGRPHPEDDVSGYVLSSPKALEKELISRAIEKASDNLLDLTCKPLNRVMNVINSE